MSKDIRSYFMVSPKNDPQTICVNKKKTTKRVIISDSESDDEDVKIKEKQLVETTKKEVKSSYFENLKPVKPSDVFGSGPIKRVKRTKEKINKEKLLEDDFDSTLMHLDDVNVNLLMEKSSSNDTVGFMSKEVVDNKNKAEPTKFSPSKTNGHSRKKQEKSPKAETITLKRKRKISSSESNEDDSKVDQSSPKKSKLFEKHDNPSASESPVKSPVKKTVPKDETIVPKSKSSPNKNKLFSKSENSSTVLSPVKSSIKKAVSETKNKNDCLDLSESDSEEENIKVIYKKKNESPEKLIKSDLSSISNRDNNLTNIKENPLLKNKYNSDGKPQLKKTIKESSQLVPVPDRKPPIVSSLWVDKYKPTSLKQVIGQQGDKSCVNKLLIWLKNWQKNQNGKTKLVKPSLWAKDHDGAYFKAALLSGPPGIGKTTTAHLVCKELGFDVVEFNASDTRSKKSLRSEVSELLSTKSLAPYFSSGTIKEVTTKHVLLMDEVDGMAGNEDRGGVQELIQLIKSSRVPIICMCNDRNHPKIRSLVNYCFDLRFNRPRVEQIKGAMMSICFKEKLKISPDKMTEIINSTNHDIRLVLNHLSVLAAQNNSNLPNSQKYIKIGPWDVLRKVFSEEELKKMNMFEKSDLFFYDYSIAPLFVQENYLSVVPHAKLNKIEKIKVFAKTAESISNGDVVDKVIRSSNAWSLLPVQAIFASVVPGETLKGHIGSQINFPSWLGKNSTKNKMDRLQQELLVHTRLKASGSKEAINMDYSSHLRDLIVRPLLENGSDGVESALSALQNYDLLKEDLESLSELCKWPNKKDLMDKIESKTKAAFTRAYNKSTVLPTYATTTLSKKGRGAVDSMELLGEENEEDALVEEPEEDDDNVEVDAMIIVKKKQQKPSKKQLENSASTSRSKQRGTGQRGRRGKK